jgi:hypothetical protein
MFFGHSWLKEKHLPASTGLLLDLASFWNADFIFLVLWQIDVFGNSGRTASLLRPFGFSSAIVNRIPWEWKHLWRRNGGMEFFWNPPLENISDVWHERDFPLTHVLYDHYTYTDLQADDEDRSE